jgi:hypothetical protein
MIQLKVSRRAGAVGVVVLLLISVVAVKSGLSNSGAADIPNNGFVAKSICGATGKALCVPGVTGPGGGTIFYVDSDNRYPTFTYLEAAPAGWSGAEGKDDPTLTWCSDITHRIESSVSTWTSRKVGAGKANTASMIAACKSGAANTIDEYNKSSRSTVKDWFLPSIGEIILLTDNMQGLGDLVASDYWSSSEFSDSGGWAQSVSHGYQGSATKNTTFYIRPIRSF